MRLAQYLAAAALAVSAACETSANHVLGIATTSGGGGGATHLSFTVEPAGAVAGVTMTPAIQVAAQDASGNADTTYTNSVTVAIGTNPAAGTLGGTTAIVPVR